MSSLLRLRALVRDADFRQGFRDEALLMPGMLAWGLVSGVALVKGGLSTAWALAMSLLVYSAGAQLTGLAMLVSGAPVWVIIAAAACINLRFVIFSAGLRPYLLRLAFWQRAAIGYVTTDLSYVVFMRRYGHSRAHEPGQVPYLLGCNTVNWLGWQGMTVLGILFADVTPTTWGLDFAGTLALLGLSVSLIVDRKSACAALVAGLVALAARDLPLRLNVVLAIAAAVTTGMALERLDRGARPPA